MQHQTTSNQMNPPSINSIFHTFVWVILLIAGCILWLIAYTATHYNHHFQRRYFESLENVQSKGPELRGPAKEHLPPKIILFWNNYGTIQPYEFGLGHSPFVKHRCTIHNCMTTQDKKMLPKADAVIFHVRGLEEQSKEDLPKHAHPKQLFIFFTLESPIHTYHNLTAFNDYFNLTFSYREDSDIHCPLGKITHRPANKPYRGLNLKSINSTKTKLAAWVISRCDKEGSLRWEYGKELAKHMPLDVYGKCGTLHCPRSHFGIKCYTEISKRYKFYLAFENSYCRDYATEKLWRTLQYDLVPVVLGGADYSKDLPPKSHINIKDFDSPKHLAQYLQHLASDHDAYLEYFKWKYKLRLRTVTLLRRDGFCKLCEILHSPERYRYKEDFDLYKWWDVDGECLDTDDLADVLGLHPHRHHQ